MKGHFWAWFKRDVPISLVGIVAFGGVMYQLICVRTKRAYTDFYKVSSYLPPPQILPLPFVVSLVVISGDTS